MTVTDRQRLLEDVSTASAALFMAGYEDPPNSVIFDPHGVIEEIQALASALRALENEK